MKNENLPQSVKDVMVDNMHKLLCTMMMARVPFRIVLWNNDDWSNKLPESIMKDYPEQLILDIKEDILEESWVEEEKVYFSIMFNGEETIEYLKEIRGEDIVVIMSEDNQPIQINDFREIIKEESQSGISKEDIVYSLNTTTGVSEDVLSKSLDVFTKD